MRMRVEVAWTLMMMGLLVSSTAEAGVDIGCMDVVMKNMMSCAPFMKGDGAASTPGKACCDGLDIVVKKDPHCLCVAIAAAPSLGMPLNMTRVAALPALCHQPNLLSKCEAATPAPAPEPHPSLAAAPAPTSGSSTTISASCILMTVLALLHLIAIV